MIKITFSTEKKYYKKYVKKVTKDYGEEAGYEIQEKKGQNFTVTYGLDQADNRMWAAYFFEDNIFYSEGNIRSVVQFMNLLPYSSKEYDYEELYNENNGIKED